jgi:hypothetical protein
VPAALVAGARTLMLGGSGSSGDGELRGRASEGGSEESDGGAAAEAGV